MDADEPILVSSLKEPLDRINSNFLRIKKYIIDTLCEILKRFYQEVFKLNFLQNLNRGKKNQRSTQALCRNYWKLGHFEH